MIQRVLGWVAALGALNPYHADFQKNGWTPVDRAGHALLNFFENKTAGKIAGFKWIRDKNGAQRLYRVVREDTEENRVAIVEGLGSADRVKKLADAEIERCADELLNHCGGTTVEESVLKEFEKTFEQVLDETVADEDLGDLAELYAELDASIDDAVVADSEHLQEMCEDFREEYFKKLPKGAFDPPPKERAMFLWLGYYPKEIEEIHRKFGPATSIRRRNGKLLKVVRDHIKDTGLLAKMLVGAYPALKDHPDYVEELINPPKGRRAYFDIDHFLAQLADCCFNFVVMWRFVNQSVGATNRALAKREYVSLDVADEIRDTAVEVLRGVRARVSA